MVNSENAIVENEMTITVVFPDGDMPQPTNGGFGTQDKFREFLVKYDTGGKWNSHIQIRPNQERIQDYHRDVIAQAFPLHFPYGYSGLPGDRAHELCVKAHGDRPFLKRNRLEVLRKLLQHRKRCFHGPEFNLVAENIIMKQTIFESARLICSVKGGMGATSMAEKFGSLTAKGITRAITANRKKDPVMYSLDAEYQFLKSVEATCRSLPHTNEASMENRKIYFSFLMKFGLPCIFLTVTPDDNRSFRIILYKLEDKHRIGINPEEMTDAEILVDFKIRQETRVQYPGLCAEEYSRIMSLVIKHVFGWDVDNPKNNKTGLFGDVVAWCLAMEEQGRKTLHGHFLIFLKNWKPILKALQGKGNIPCADVPTHAQAITTTHKLFRLVCSANLFNDFASPNGALKEHQVFSHLCGKRPKPKAARYTVIPATNQELREMRHKQMCQEHLGKVATCPACGIPFTVGDIVSRALQAHHKDSKYQYPDFNRRLDAKVNAMGNDFNWTELSPEQRALRYFSCNALVNLHSVTHASRCFKKGSECYANLPDRREDAIAFIYNEDHDVWSDWLGHKSKRYMFRVYPQRNTEDVFMNSHNPILTQVLCCNTNVMVAMNGCSVYYVTGYNAKSTQKEEKAAFEVISEVVVKHLENQVCHLSKIMQNHVYV